MNRIECLEFDGITCEVTRKRIRNMYLRISQDGAICVSAPSRASVASIRTFVLSRRGWIDRRRRYVMSHPSPEALAVVTGDTIKVWGRPHSITLSSGARWSVEPRSVSPDDSGTGSILVTATPTADQEARQGHLLSWYRSLLEAEAPLHFARWAAETGLVPDEWRCRSMSSRWGSCVIGKRRIWLNVHLAEYPVECLDYVILHELCHLSVPNHGPEFYRLVEQYLPTWRDARDLLNG